MAEKIEDAITKEQKEILNIENSTGSLQKDLVTSTTDNKSTVYETENNISTESATTDKNSTVDKTENNKSTVSITTDIKITVDEKKDNKAPITEQTENMMKSKEKNNSKEKENLLNNVSSMAENEKDATVLTKSTVRKNEQFEENLKVTSKVEKLDIEKQINVCDDDKSFSIVKNSQHFSDSFTYEKDPEIEKMIKEAKIKPIGASETLTKTTNSIIIDINNNTNEIPQVNKRPEVIDVNTNIIDKTTNCLIDINDLPPVEVISKDKKKTEKTQLPPSKSCFDTISLSEPCCRVCQCCSEEENLISPCNCSGSVKWVHESCLVHWMKSSFKDSCELCLSKIEIAKRIKPLSKWKLPSRRPTPVVWVLVFVTAIALNLASIVKDASRLCSTTPCLVFYAVGCMGIILGSLFLIFWTKRARSFFNHWLEQNEEWVVILENKNNENNKIENKHPPPPKL